MAEDPTTKKKKDPNAIEVIEPEKVDDTPAPDLPPTAYELGQYVVFLNAMKYTKKHVDVAPTATPRNFYESIVFFDDGVDVRLYLFINGVWRYVTMT